MGDGNKQSVKELIEELRVLHGSTTKRATLSDLAAIYGISRQNLTNWQNPSPEHEKRNAFIEKARKDLGWDEAKAYKKTIKKQKS